MKKIISITIALCLVFASILPVYAEAWTSQQAYATTLNVQNIYQYLRDFLLSYNSGQTSDWTFGDLYWEIHRIGSWLAPIGSNDGTYETLWSALLNIAIDTRSYLPHIPTIATYVVNWMGDNLNYLSRINTSLTNNFNNAGSTAQDKWVNNAHTFLGDNNAVGWPYGWYDTLMIRSDGSYYTQGINWTNGTPIGNVAVLLKYLNENNNHQFLFNKSAMLTHYNDNLTTWDSQGSTLTQVAFTPDSAIQGLYRYLAFTQRDVARLAYVFANDEELEARELAQANQEQILDDFIDPNGQGAVSASDFGSMAGASDSVKDNFNTGYSSSNVWDIFNSDHYGWFSQECADSLDTTGSNTRSLKSSSGYDTPLLNSYYEQILSLGGDN